MSIWTRDWPTEGLYWFYGSTYKGEDLGYHLVRVRHGAGAFPFYIVDGHFLHELPPPVHLTAREADMHHEYRADKSSLEYVALELRKALSNVLPLARSGAEQDVEWRRIEAAEKALALAEAAGIKAP